MSGFRWLWSATELPIPTYRGRCRLDRVLRLNLNFFLLVVLQVLFVQRLRRDGSDGENWLVFGEGSSNRSCRFGTSF